MKRFFALLLLISATMFHVERSMAEPSEDAKATVILFNERDTASTTLAAAYADKRGIPFDRMIALNTSIEETISREEYEKTIAEPVRRMLVNRGWWKLRPGRLEVAESSIRFVAIMRGIPLRIARHEGDWPGNMTAKVQPPFSPNEASVDSELAIMGAGLRQITGPIPNPYFKSAQRLQQAALPQLLLVCRLDAATPRTVQRMIDDSAVAEKQGLPGFAYVDSRALPPGGLRMGDDWLHKIVSTTLKNGIPVIHEDTPALFPRGYPMRHAALYYGWYDPNITGPFLSERFRFAPGAIAVHIHSFSATTLRNPQQTWCAPLLERGAAATLGNVYEPYLHLTPHLDLFHARLLEGATFAEAAYAAQPALSWMPTFIGDPLYRPFKTKPAAPVWAAIRDGSRLWLQETRSEGERHFKQEARKLKSGLLFESLATLESANNLRESAIASLKNAIELYTDEDDITRCTLHLVGLLGNAGSRKSALSLAEKTLKRFPNAEAAPLFNAIVNPPPPPPTPEATAPAGERPSAATPRKAPGQSKPGTRP